MNGQELCGEYADYFFEKGDGLPKNLKHYRIVTNNTFTLAFPLDAELESGDITVEPFTTLFSQVRDFREYLNDTGIIITFTITTAANFRLSLNIHRDDMSNLEISGEEWAFNSFIFITFSKIFKSFIPEYFL